MAREICMSVASGPDPDPDPPRRFLGVFFTDWLIDLESALLRRAIARHERAPACDDHPLVVVEGRNRAQPIACHAVVACNDAAARGGVRVGMTVSQAEATCASQHDARAVAWRSCIDRLRQAGGDSSDRAVGRRIVAASERLVAIERDGALAARVLVRLGRCLERWIPVVSVPPELRPLLARPRTAASLDHGQPEGHILTAADGHASSADWLVGDFTGCAALFRGVHSSEQGLMRRIEACFRRRGFRVRVATASTIGAATALARFGEACSVSLARPMQAREPGGDQRTARSGCARRCIAVPKGSEAAFLASLPIESLRISPSSADALRAVEVHTVGQLAGLGRAGVAARLTGHHATDAPASLAGAALGHPARRTSRRSRHVASTPAWSGTPMLFASLAGGASEGKDAAHGMQRGDSAASPRMPVRSTPTSRPAGRWRAADDVLLRLDQALGIVPELLVPLRLREPVVIDHAFEAPCSRPDVISRVCSEMVEQLMMRLARRREGLRSATWSFAHADLPADLSTDSLPSIHRSVHRGEPSSSEGDRGHSAPQPMVSFIELGLSKPSSRASHVWSVLRARLEQIALDHGVERIECRVDRATLLRFRQARFHGRIHGRLRGSAASALRTDPSSRHGHSSDGRAALGEWIELVSARIGPASVIRTADHVSADHVSADEPPPSDLRPRVHRPSAFLPRIERAVLRGGDASRSIAHAIAARTLWRIGHPDAASVQSCVQSCARPIGSSPTQLAQLEWRGNRWPAGAIDGWERSLSSWWDSSGEHGGGRAGMHPAGHLRNGLPPVGCPPTGLLARIAIVTSDGWLWLLVRWPERLPVPRSTHDFASSEGGVHHGLHADRPHERADRWFSGSSRSIEHGVELEVLGFWS